MKRFFMVVVLSIFGILAQVLMKRGLRGIAFVDMKGMLNQLPAVLFNPWIVVAMIIYVIGFVAYLLLLTKMEVSTLYPLIVATSFTVLALSSMIFLSEIITVTKILGMGIIILGISLIVLSM